MEAIVHYLELARQAALDAGKAIMDVYRSGTFETSLKSGNFPVTKADRTAHQIITTQLEKTGLPVLSEEGDQPHYPERKQWEYFWLIDPLDGTREFLHKNGEFTVNIALMHRQAPAGGVIYVPGKDLLYLGSTATGVYKIEKGIQTTFTPLPRRVQLIDLLQKEHISIAASRSHMTAGTKAFIDQFKSVSLSVMGSSLKFMLLLENKADVYPRMGPTMEWDTAAAHAILNASNRGVYREDLSAELVYNKQELVNPFFIAF